jgi:hypothetical protein
MSTHTHTHTHTHTQRTVKTEISALKGFVYFSMPESCDMDVTVSAQKNST